MRSCSHLSLSLSLSLSRSVRSYPFVPRGPRVCARRKRMREREKPKLYCKKTSVVVGTRRSFFSGNQRVIGSHAKWASVIGHRRLRRPTRTNNSRCFFCLSFRLERKPSFFAVAGGCLNAWRVRARDRGVYTTFRSELG